MLPSSDVAAEIMVLQGDNQHGAPGAVLPIVVQVKDGAGTPLAGQRVTFTPDPTAGAGQVTPGTAETNAEGIAEATWVLGTSSGTQAVLAQVVGTAGVSATLEASVQAAGSRRIELASGQGQIGVVGTLLAEPLVVQVTDEFGNPVPDVAVEWDTDQGTVSPGSSTTGTDGRTQTAWVLGASTGSQVASASVDGLEGSPILFTATALAGTPSTLLEVSGNGQTAQPGEQLPTPLIVRLVDSEGNGIPGRPVTWVVGTGAGTVSPISSITDASGEAQTTWTLGSASATNTVNAVVSGVGVVTFTATAASGGEGSVPTRMAFKAQPTDVAERHDIISPPVEVEVLDQAGNRYTGRRMNIRLDLIEIETGRSRGFDVQRTKSGVAVYPELHMNLQGEFFLRASADGLPTVDSDRFTVGN